MIWALQLGFYWLARWEHRKSSLATLKRLEADNAGRPPAEWWDRWTAESAKLEQGHHHFCHGLMIYCTIFTGVGIVWAVLAHFKLA